MNKILLKSTIQLFFFFALLIFAIGGIVGMVIYSTSAKKQIKTKCEMNSMYIIHFNVNRRPSHEKVYFDVPNQKEEYK